MKLVPAFFFSLVLAVGAATATSLRPFDPSELDVDTIKIGIVIVEGDGTTTLLSADDVEAQEIVSYMERELNTMGRNIPVVLDQYFSFECGFQGAIRERYRPNPAVSEGRSLNMFFTLSRDKKIEGNLRLCAPQFIRFRRDWPNHHPAMEYYKACLKEKSAGRNNLVNNLNCVDKAKLDWIIWGLSHPKSRR